MEKLLLEACIEVIQNHGDILVGIQDMGAAGLVSSTSEMASKAGSGLRLNLDNVPQRETEMIPYEMMLSESQERMVLCVKKGHEQEIIDLFKKYDLDAVNIGQVTDDGFYTLYHKGKWWLMFQLIHWRKMLQLITVRQKFLSEFKNLLTAKNIFQKLQTARSVKFSKNFWLNRQLLARNQFMKLMIRA